MKKKEYICPASLLVPLTHPALLNTASPYPPVNPGEKTGEALSRQYDGEDEEFD